MVENTLVKEQLTGAMIDAGAALTQQLDAIGVPLTAALWWFVPELNEWRLYFASPEATTSGPLAVFAKIQQARDRLKEKEAIPFLVIRVLDGEDELVRHLRRGPRSGPDIKRFRLSKTVVDGHYIDDALIYRVV